MLVLVGAGASMVPSFVIRWWSESQEKRKLLRVTYASWMACVTTMTKIYAFKPPTLDHDFGPLGHFCQETLRFDRELWSLTNTIMLAETDSARANQVKRITELATLHEPWSPLAEESINEIKRCVEQLRSQLERVQNAHTPAHTRAHWLMVRAIAAVTDLYNRFSRSPRVP